MSIESAIREVLEPLIERVEAAAQGVAERAESAGRVDASGLPPDRAAFTVKELTQLLQSDAETIRQLYHSGQLEGRQTGNRILIWRWSVLEFMGLQAPHAAKRKARPQRRA